MGKYKELAERIGNLVDDKNAAYGSSFDQAGDFLKLLYPDGIPVDSYTDMLCVVRIFDKLKRIATRKDAFGESPYGDIVGYGLLGLYKDGGAGKVENTEVSTPVDAKQTVAEEAAPKKTEHEKSFEEKRTEELGYYKLNTVMQDRAKVEYEEQQKAKIKEMIEARQKAVPAPVVETEVKDEPIKKKEEEPKLIKTNCKICNLEVDQLVDEREIKSGKIVVHQDCYTKWQREQKLKQSAS